MVTILDIADLIDSIPGETNYNIITKLIQLSNEYKNFKKSSNDLVFKVFLSILTTCYTRCPSKRRLYGDLLYYISKKIDINFLKDNIPILLKRAIIDLSGKCSSEFIQTLRVEEAFAFGDLIPHFYDFLGKEKSLFEGNKEFIYNGAYPNSILDIIIKDDLQKLTNYYSHNSIKDHIGGCFLHELMGMKIIKYQSPLDASAHYGSIKCFRFLMLEGCEINISTVRCSIYGGNLEIIRLCEQTGIFNKSPMATREALIAAVETSQTHLIRWLADTYNVRPTDDMWKNAFSSKKPEQPLIKDDFYSDRMIAAEISFGNFGIVEKELVYRESINAPMTFDLTNFAYCHLNKVAEIIKNHPKSMIFRLCVSSSPLLLAAAEEIIINSIKIQEDVEYSTNPFTAIILSRNGL